MSRIITFYSYKGGVGRTLALANIGVLLAKRGKRVLLMDWDLEAPGLDRYFRPEYTDLVTPYFYPVGTTTLGPAQEGDAWPVTLGGLLSELAPRLPPGKGLLPVLQGFEQTGYPVGSGFLAEQLAVYRRSWPTLSNVAIFSWKIAEGETAPLVELADLPTLQRGVCTFFASLSPGPARCRWSNVIPFR